MISSTSPYDYRITKIASSVIDGDQIITLQIPQGNYNIRDSKVIVTVTGVAPAAVAGVDARTYQPQIRRDCFPCAGNCMIILDGETIMQTQKLWVAQFCHYQNLKDVSHQDSFTPSNQGIIHRYPLQSCDRVNEGDIFESTFSFDMQDFFPYVLNDILHVENMAIVQIQLQNFNFQIFQRKSSDAIYAFENDGVTPHTYTIYDDYCGSSSIITLQLTLLLKQFDNITVPKLPQFRYHQQCISGSGGINLDAKFPSIQQDIMIHCDQNYYGLHLTELHRFGVPPEIGNVNIQRNSAMIVQANSAADLRQQMKKTVACMTYYGKPTQHMNFSVQGLEPTANFNYSFYVGILY